MLRFIGVWILFVFWGPFKTEASSFIHKNFEAEKIIFIKLGGSLITHKMMPHTERPEVIEKLAKELAKLIKSRPDIKVIVGHGSGSFGHRAAIEHNYDRKLGFFTPRDGATVAKTARELHAIVITALLKAGVPAFSIPPSATGRLERKTLRLMQMDIKQIQKVLDIGGVPVVYGDVIPFKDGKGMGIASTEKVFSFLAGHFKPSKILLLGEVKGVYHPGCDLQDIKTSSPIAELTPKMWTKIVSSIEEESGYAVTGGMRQKVDQMVDIIKHNSQIKVHIASGLTEGVLEELLSSSKMGTVIQSRSTTSP